MGLYDYIRCEYPIDAPQGLLFQTKDTDIQYLEEYKIDADGYLWLFECEREFKPNEGKEGFAYLAGSVKTVSSEWKKQPNFRGAIRFYTTDDNGISWKYSALFDDGKIINMKQIAGAKDTPE